MKEKYKPFYRLYPRLRLSWSLYLLYTRNNWDGIWAYLTGQQRAATDKQSMGTLVHEWIKDNGYRKILGVERILPVIGLEKRKRVYQERKLTRELDDCDIVAVPDLNTKTLVVDWKTGKMTGYEQQMQLYMWMLGEECRDAFLVGISPILKDGKLRAVQAGRVFQYKRAPDVELWEDRFITMAQDIKRNIRKLDVFIRNNY